MFPLKGNTLCLAQCGGRVVIRGCVRIGFWLEVMLQLDHHGQAMKSQPDFYLVDSTTR